MSIQPQSNTVGAEPTANGTTIAAPAAAKDVAKNATATAAPPAATADEGGAMEVINDIIDDAGKTAGGECVLNTSMRFLCLPSLRHCKHSRSCSRTCLGLTLEPVTVFFSVHIGSDHHPPPHRCGSHWNRRIVSTTLVEQAQKEGQKRIQGCC